MYPCKPLSPPPHPPQKNYTISKIMIWYLEIDLGNEILWAHRMYNEVSKLWSDFDSRLRIKVTALWSFPILCLYREAIRLQSFLPTRYMRGAVTRTYEHDEHYPIYYIYASRHCVATSYTVMLSGHFFLLLVSAMQLEKKTKKQKKQQPLETDTQDYQLVGPVFNA